MTTSAVPSRGNDGSGCRITVKGARAMALKALGGIQEELG